MQEEKDDGGKKGPGTHPERLPESQDLWKRYILTYRNELRRMPGRAGYLFSFDKAAGYEMNLGTQEPPSKFTWRIYPE